MYLRPLCQLKTVPDILMKVHTNVKHHKMRCTNYGPLNFENNDFCNIFVSALELENCSRYFLETLSKCISP